MRRYPLTYAEWGNEEYRATLGLHRPLSANDTEPPLLAQLQRIYRNPAGIYLFNAGRNALRLALEVLRQERRDDVAEVILPSYICASVVEAVIGAGCLPVFADIDERLNIDPASVTALIGPGTLAVLAAHMYGAPAQIEAIEAICRKHDVRLIDDAAQVAGVAVAGRPLGTFGDVGILSFAQSKTLVTGIAGSGGALIVNRPTLRPAVELHHARLPPPGRRLAERARFLIDYLWKSRLGHAGYYLDRLGLLASTRDPYAPARMAPHDAYVARLQATKLDALIAGKRAAIERYAERLKTIPGIAFPQYLPGIFLTRLMVALPAGSDRETIRSKLRRRGVDTRPGYPAQVETASQKQAQTDTTLARLIELPLHGHMPATDIDYICTQLAHCLQDAPHPRPHS